MDTKYEGLLLIPSRQAAYEMSQLSLSIEDCLKILDDGYSPRKRAKDVIEKWLDEGKKTYNVVIVKSFNFMLNEGVWLIKHVGRFSKR